MKKAISICILILLVCSLSACASAIPGDAAKVCVNDFLSALEAEDYTGAEALLHPERPADLQSFIERLEKEGDVDFSKIEIEKYTGFKSASYDSSVKGAMYCLYADLLVSGEEVEMEIEIVKNDIGYGIYNLYFDVD